MRNGRSCALVRSHAFDDAQDRLNRHGARSADEAAHEGCDAGIALPRKASQGDESERKPNPHEHHHIQAEADLLLVRSNAAGFICG